MFERDYEEPLGFQREYAKRLGALLTPLRRHRHLTRWRPALGTYSTEESSPVPSSPNTGNPPAAGSTSCHSRGLDSA